MRGIVAEQSIVDAVEEFLGGGEARGRYASFDYCYNYFREFARPSQGSRRGLNDLKSPEHLQTSCLHLAAYLSSYGMYRASSPLLQASMAALVPVVECLAVSNAALWQLDVDDYNDETIGLILESVQKLRKETSRALQGLRKKKAKTPFRASDTLVTKIMMGTMGCVPAFDTYFMGTLGVKRLDKESLVEVSDFYVQHCDEIDQIHHSRRTRQFASGDGGPEFSNYPLTRARIIDMTLLVRGGGLPT
jgi:hypothetical protein